MRGLHGIHEGYQCDKVNVFVRHMLQQQKWNDSLATDLKNFRIGWFKCKAEKLNFAKIKLQSSEATQALKPIIK